MTEKVGGESLQVGDLSENTEDVSFGKLYYDFASVKPEIRQKILSEHKTISMKILHYMYNDGHMNDTRYRNKLKNMIFEEFWDELIFLKTGRKTPEIPLSEQGINFLKTSFDKKHIINEAAGFRREDILEYATKII